jgi:RND family efflux transporter MFP subunit
LIGLMERIGLNWKTTLVVCLLILALAAGVTTVIFQTEPTAQRSSASKRTAMLVDVIRPERGTYRPEITAMGTVRAEKEIELSPRIGGEIIELSEAFTPGGFVEKNAILLQIDPSDYEVSLLQRKSELRQATADLEMELGRQDLAEKDYRALEGTISSEYKTLVLRQPQLNSARARVEAAQAAVRRASLDLERTRIRAPFAAHIISRDAHIGSQVSPGDLLGRLVGIESYWVEAAIPVTQLRWIEFPEDGKPAGSSARVRNRIAWPDGTFREAKVHRLIGALESQTRMARVLLTVADPLAHEPESTGLPPLMVGSFVEVQIEGKAIEDVIRMDRDFLRKNDTVWLKEDGVLRIRKVDIVFQDNEHVYIREGLNTNDAVVTTNLATVLDGAPLWLEGEVE